MRPPCLPFLLLAWSGCALVSEADLAARMDLDGDGIDRPADCDDLDVTVGVPGEWLVDADEDGYGGEATVTACLTDGQVSATPGDCDDSEVTVFPGAAESCNLADDDCDGEIDEGVLILWYIDADGDGYGNLDVAREDCAQPDGFVAEGTDCDDTNADLNPETLWYPDGDADGYGASNSGNAACVAPIGSVADATDCDDTRADVSPAGSEVCDDGNADEDCDGAADDLDDSATGQTSWYPDADGDGFGDALSPVSACDAPPNTLDDRRDCDDLDATVTNECRWTQVSAGDYANTCGLHEDGSVECWGHDVPDPEGMFTSISSGFGYACGVLTDGTLSCWGNASKGEDAAPAGTFTQVSAAFYHACGLSTAGTIECWGLDTGGAAAPTTGGFVAISVGWYSGCAIDASGAVTGWYDAEHISGTYTAIDAIYDGCSGMDSAGEIDDASDPKAGAAPDGPFASYSVGVLAGCALDAAGAPECWGSDSYGIPAAPPGPFASISVGLHHACALTEDGFIECWGDNTSGCLDVPN